MATPARARNNYKGNGRHYQTPEGWVPSVTNIIDMKDKPALIPWAANKTAHLAVTQHRVLSEMVEKGARAEAYDWLRGEWERNRDHAADRGTVAHEDIERSLVLGITNERYYTFTKQALAFLEYMDFRPGAPEVTVVGNGYAGTGDLIAYRADSASVLIDWKTGKNWRYESTAMQLAALMDAPSILTDDGTTSFASHCVQGYSVHLTEEGFSYATLDRDSATYWKHLQAFNDLKSTKHYASEMKTPDSIWDTYKKEEITSGP